VSIKLSGGSGDADLHVKFGAKPTTSSFDCRPYLGGNNEECKFSTTSAGTYHVMLNAYEAYSGATLVADYQTVTQPPAGSVKVFQHCNFGGYTATLPIGTYDLAKLVSLGVKNDDISSIQVPAGYKVTLYQHDKQTGTTLVKTQNDSCLVAAGFNDAVSSIKVEAAQ
jgi:hypothetical protein